MVLRIPLGFRYRTMKPDPRLPRDHVFHEKCRPSMVLAEYANHFRSSEKYAVIVSKTFCLKAILQRRTNVKYLRCAVLYRVLT
jgi:hypothetical protein